jgi:hypothetical protein
MSSSRSSSCTTPIFWVYANTAIETSSLEKMVQNAISNSGPLLADRVNNVALGK